MLRNLTNYNVCFVRIQTNFVVHSLARGTNSYDHHHFCDLPNFIAAQVTLEIMRQFLSNEKKRNDMEEKDYICFLDKTAIA